MTPPRTRQQSGALLAARVASAAPTAASSQAPYRRKGCHQPRSRANPKKVTQPRRRVSAKKVASAGTSFVTVGDSSVNTTKLDDSFDLSAYLHYQSSDAPTPPTSDDTASSPCRYHIQLSTQCVPHLTTPELANRDGLRARSPSSQTSLSSTASNLDQMAHYWDTQYGRSPIKTQHDSFFKFSFCGSWALCSPRQQQFEEHYREDHVPDVRNHRTVMCGPQAALPVSPYCLSTWPDAPGSVPANLGTVRTAVCCTSLPNRAVDEPRRVRKLDGRRIILCTTVQKTDPVLQQMEYTRTVYTHWSNDLRKASCFLDYCWNMPDPLDVNVATTIDMDRLLAPSNPSPAPLGSKNKDKNAVKTLLSNHSVFSALQFDGNVPMSYFRYNKCLPFHSYCSKWMDETDNANDGEILAASADLKSSASDDCCDAMELPRHSALDEVFFPNT